MQKTHENIANLSSRMTTLSAGIDFVSRNLSGLKEDTLRDLDCDVNEMTHFLAAIMAEGEPVEPADFGVYSDAELRQKVFDLTTSREVYESARKELSRRGR